MVSQKPWRPEAVLLLLSGMMLTLSVSMLGIHLVQGEDLAPKFVTFLVSTLGVQCVALVLLHFFLRQHAVRWSEFFGVRERRIVVAVLFALGIAVVAMPLAWGLNLISAKLIEAFHGAPEQQLVVKVLEETRDPLQRTVFALTAIVMAPVVEESLFRGILYPLLKYRGYPRAALWGSSLLFAAIHLNLMTFLPLLFFALVLIWIYERTDTLLAPIVAHATFNSINFLIFMNQSLVDRLLDPTP
ncbi:MAG: CPBP family intramembrane metalloprotease [Verrucomicrobia subdivision 3 bacterium]|nr:CPBP family intramembrane metalloprotease [Limisphaerales bacterium]